MQQKQLVLQRVVMVAALVLSCLTFVVALGFSTDVYNLNYHADSSSTLLYVDGAELFYQIQPFNKQLLRDAAILMVLCALMFVFLTHKRRLYYVSNYITTAVYAGFAGYLAATLLANSLYIKELYGKVDFERMKEVTEMLNMRYMESTFMLDASITVSILLFVLILFLIINLILKSVWMRKEKANAKGAA